MNKRRRFKQAPESVPAARRFATNALRGLDQQVLEIVELMVSELASNCIRHAVSAFELTVIEHDGQEIRVEARDFGGGEPVVREAGAGGDAGRGLRIVDALASAWGVEQTDGGKTVWFEVALETPHPATPQTTSAG